LRGVTVLRSRENLRVKRWAKLVQDSRFRRQEQRTLLEGPHLLGAFLERGLKPLNVLATASALGNGEISALVRQAGLEPIVLSDAVFRAIADTETPPGIAAEIAIPQLKPGPSMQTVFLEGVQDPANVGAIIRSAAAFAAGVIVLDRACADPWSPKALRAGMGGHFRVALKQVQDLQQALKSHQGKLIATVARDGVPLRDAQLSGQPGWIFGAEGGGLSSELQEKAGLRVTIPITEGTESLNVAAAAAICLHATFEAGRRR
jgi:TrmH family RNA methyltransferase